MKEQKFAKESQLKRSCSRLSSRLTSNSRQNRCPNINSLNMKASHKWTKTLNLRNLTCELQVDQAFDSGKVFPQWADLPPPLTCKKVIKPLKPAKCQTLPTVTRGSKLWLPKNSPARSLSRWIRKSAVRKLSRRWSNRGNRCCLSLRDWLPVLGQRLLRKTKGLKIFL